MEVEIGRLLRELAPRVLGAVVRRCRDFAAAEDAVQEAMMAAAVQWPRDGAPESPRAWLTQVAMRRLVDEIRRDTARRERENVAAMASPQLGAAEDDDTPTLIHMCCHPALTPSSAIALTLRAVGGLTTAEIARAFLVPEATMAQRISRAKRTIQEAGAVFRMPEGAERAANLRNVLHVLYLIFNEGYVAGAGERHQRTDLAGEAIRLTRLVYAGRECDPEVAGLLALMLLTDARRAARTGPSGEPIPLDRQDRGLWDRAAIEEGMELLERALGRGAVGPYQLQAAVAAVHDQAASAEETDWAQIVALYELLLKMADNPMGRLSHAVAVGMTRGAEEGLRLVKELARDARMREHHRLYAVQGHLHEMAGAPGEAVADYLAAAERTASLPERNYLMERAARLREEAG